MRIDPTKTPKEPTYQVVLDSLALSPLYPAFLITTEVPEIYMHKFWHTITKIKNKSSYKFKMDKKKCTIDVEVFRDILQICPRLPNQEFDALPSDEEVVSFNKELGHKRDIKSVTDVGYPASPSKKKTLVDVEEPAEKPAKKPDLKDSLLVFKSETLLLKKAIKRSKQETNIHQVGGLSEGVDLESKVPDEPKGKSIDTNTDDDNNDDQQSDDERIESDDDDKDADINKTEDEEDEFVHTPDDYVPTIYSSISSDYAAKFLNFDNIPSGETEIISMMDIKVQHEDPSIQTSPLLTVPVTVIPETSSAPVTTIPPPIPPFISL
ncbi:hypothetical protein Tco_0108959 [Tanacetum coccineum]